MAACTFFGHRDTPSNILPHLYDAIVTLIEEEGVDTFYVGSEGAFDRMVRSTLRTLSVEYPQIRYAVVLAYLPRKSDEDTGDTLYPEGFERIPPRYAISRRNRWMIERSEYVICYQVSPAGGTAKSVAMAATKGKTIRNLAVGLRRPT